MWVRDREREGEGECVLSWREREIEREREREVSVSEFNSRASSTQICDLVNLLRGYLAHRKPPPPLGPP